MNRFEERVFGTTVKCTITAGKRYEMCFTSTVANTNIYYCACFVYIRTYSVLTKSTIQQQQRLVAGSNKIAPTGKNPMWVNNYVNANYIVTRNTRLRSYFNYYNLSCRTYLTNVLSVWRCYFVRKLINYVSWIPIVHL